MNVKDTTNIGARPARWAVAGLVGTSFLLGACTVGPKYHKPTVPTPPVYKERGPVASEQEAGWKTAQPGDDHMTRGKWWETFNDPQLNALEEQVNISNQNLKVAEAQFRQARALVRSNRAAYYPTISTGPSITATHPSANRSIRTVRAGTFADYVFPMDLSYEADAWGRVRQTVEESRANAQAAAADLETIRLSLQAELAVDYFEMRALDSQKQLLDSTVAAYEKALELTTNRYKSGVASGAEVAQAETQLETTQAQAIDLGVQRAEFEHAVAVLVGQPASDFSAQAAPITLRLPEIPVGLPSELLERRPDIAAAERRVAAANAQIGVAKTAYFPVLTLAGSSGFESTAISDWLSWPSRLWSVGPSLVETLFDGGRRRALSEQAQAAYEATVASYRESVLTAFQEVEDNLAAMRILADEDQKQEAAVKAAQRSLALSLNRYKGGVVSYLEVVTAQSAALANERAAVDVSRRRMAASVQLVKALGGGWEASNLPTAQNLK